MGTGFDRSGFDYANAAEELWLNGCNDPERIYDMESWEELSEFMNEYDLFAEDFLFRPRKTLFGLLRKRRQK
ncbi:MAG: hypothetical protein J5822_08665 [Eubacteriaceae bacterium]|nr:hypothetical protein [Eubacteriaceae bacterium]